MRFPATADDLFGDRLADDLRASGFDIDDDQIGWDDGEVVLPDDLGETAAVKAVVAAHLAAPPDTTLPDALRTRDARSEAMVQPTADLLTAIAARLAAERSSTAPDADLVLILEALRQLGLKGVADEAAAGSREYADLYLSHVPDTPL